MSNRFLSSNIALGIGYRDLEARSSAQLHAHQEPEPHRPPQHHQPV